MFSLPPSMTVWSTCVTLYTRGTTWPLPRCWESTWKLLLWTLRRQLGSAFSTWRTTNWTLRHSYPLTICRRSLWRKDWGEELILFLYFSRSFGLACLLAMLGMVNGQKFRIILVHIDSTIVRNNFIVTYDLLSCLVFKMNVTCQHWVGNKTATKKLERIDIKNSSSSSKCAVY